MYRYFFVAKNNMKKQKGDMITFFVMTFLASFMIFICMNLLTGTFRVCDTNKEAINGADILILKKQDKIGSFMIKEIIQGDEYTDGYEENKYLSTMAKYRKKGVKNWSDYPFDIACYEEERNIHTTSIDTKNFSGNDIVIPISLSTSYKVGDYMELKIDENIYEFRVAGFNEDFIYSSPINLGTYLVYVSEKMYSQIEFENPNYAERNTLIKTQLSEKAISENVSGSDECDRIYNEYNSWVLRYQETHPDTAAASGNWIPADMLLVSGKILPFMFIAIILVFALIILTIALVVIDFSVKNFIIDNMKNTGIMEAGGYTVKEMIIILLVQLLTASASGSIIGTVMAALLQKKVGFIMLYLLGLSWNQKPDMAVFASVILGICSIVAIFALLLGREYKKTTVLDALRGGINTHNYKKNMFPFDKTALPITLTLALKETFGKFRSQIGVILIMAVLSFSAAMGFAIYENMGKDVDALLRISGLDLNDADFTGNESMADEVRNMDMVDRIRFEYWTGVDFVVGKKTKSLTARVISDTSQMREDQMVEGRWPKYENEVALGTSAANNLGVKVGDTVIIRNGEDEASYIVTGLMQTFNNMGMMGYMPTDAYERIGKVPTTKSYKVNLKKGYTVQDFEKQFKEIYPDTEVIDELASTGGLFVMLKTSMAAIMVFIMIITAIIVALAEALLIRIRITKEWRNLGVNKALGFTSNQLISQIMISNMPPILIGIVLGLVGVTFLGDKTMLLMFMIFVFKKVAFALSPIAYIFVVVVIVGVALAVSWFNGKRIKKLEPVKMITEE